MRGTFSFGSRARYGLGSVGASCPESIVARKESIEKPSIEGPPRARLFNRRVIPYVGTMYRIRSLMLFRSRNRLIGVRMSSTNTDQLTFQLSHALGLFSQQARGTLRWTMFSRGMPRF